jgi:general secretion pathway protein B
MSYILDALRRADAERERGAVPGLHAQPVPAGAAVGEAPRVPRTALWVALAVLGGLLAAAAWRLAGNDAPAPVVATAPAALPAPAPVPPPAAAERAAAVVPPPPPARAIELRPPAAPAAARPAAAPVRRAAAPTASPPDATAAPKDRVVTLQDLPADVRRELPALKLGGSIYSEDPRSRFLIVNGQTFRENDSLAPGLTLQQIAPKSAVFAYKGWRIEIK